MARKRVNSMSVKTVRFNKREEALLRKILTYYGQDFSACVKELFATFADLAAKAGK